MASSSSPHSEHHPVKLGPLSWLSIAAAIVAVGLLIFDWFRHHNNGTEVVERHLPHFWGIGIIPFAGVLLAIALLPLIPATHIWWESNRNRLLVSLGFGGCTIAYYVLAEGWAHVPHVLEHAIVDEYIPFIILLFSLYVISGGINLRGTIAPRPAINTAILAIGALIASFVGTTGASMLLIRPLLQANASRKHVTHTVVFFIFLVSNIGGTLLPIGDPPLFLGYLKGVPFFWTLVLWKEWAFCSIALLIVYFIWDSVVYKREQINSPQMATIEQSDARLEKIVEPLGVRGAINFLWLLGVVAAVAMLDYHKPLPGTDWLPFPFMRELVMLGFVALSLWSTPRSVREDNRFNYTAILEVAALFIGIFITMQVPIQVLNVLGDQLGMTQPWQFYWSTGLLSSFLDNAPTYVVFFETANAMSHEPAPGVIQLLGGHYIRQDLLIAISLGAVFMGANTYIGNGPNFMVKSIAEQSGVRMPGFFGYMIRYSVPILFPLFLLVMFIFLL